MHRILFHLVKIYTNFIDILIKFFLSKFIKKKPKFIIFSFLFKHLNETALDKLIDTDLLYNHSFYILASEINFSKDKVIKKVFIRVKNWKNLQQLWLTLCQQM